MKEKRTALQKYIEDNYELPLAEIIRRWNQSHPQQPINSRQADVALAVLKIKRARDRSSHSPFQAMRWRKPCACIIACAVPVATSQCKPNHQPRLARTVMDMFPDAVVTGVRKVK
jgi:hypothetical protein